MAKATNTTKHRRLRKSIRKTLGTLFLISAIVVGAIPVESLEAASTDLKITVTEADSNIPKISQTEPIYTTGDGMFQFAYVQPNSGNGNKVAVILGYEFTGNLPNGTLKVPDTVDVYGKYTDNLGTFRGYVAVSAGGEFLYWEEQVELKDENGQTIYTDQIVGYDPNTGDPIIQRVPLTKSYFRPCYYDTRGYWADIDLEDLYIRTDPTASDGDAEGYTIAGNNPQNQRIKDAMVAYIGNQWVETDASGEWHASDPNNLISDATRDYGVFAGAANIKNLIIGENLSGIGNYAFYNCSYLQSVTLGNGLDTLGNYAFFNCLNLKTVNLDLGSKLSKIGDHAFYNCQGLTSITMPIATAQIGDSAFENCFNLESIELCGNGNNVALSQLGNTVFKSCTKLKNLTFPATYSEKIPVSVFEGCNSLEYITLPNINADVVEDTDGDGSLQKFKEILPPEFYFEGEQGSEIHKTCSENGFAFKYLNQDIYEVIIYDPDDSSAKATFQVNSSNQLINCDITKGMETIDMPSTIGPYQITTIDSGSFQNNCFLKKITIPSSITTIEADAFKGCHQLEAVIFQEPINITSIGTNAFQTQMVTSHRAGCPYESTTLPNDPELTFTGTISYDSAPFVYAMDPASNINRGTQKVSYIKYYSGWPTNLVVQYNPTTDKNELIDYPVMSDLPQYKNDSIMPSETRPFPYATDEYGEMAYNAYNKYIRDNGGTSYDTAVDNADIKNMTQDEQKIIDAVLDISIPNGVEAIKDGLFAESEHEPADTSLAASLSIPIDKTITTNGLAEIPRGAFSDCTNLTSINILGETTKIGDYAFENCKNLTNASISASVSEIGLRPFKGCEELIDVDFNGSPYFTCEKSIIFGLKDGEKSTIVECLESKGNGLLAGSYNGKILPEDVAGVDTIYEEAFEDCINLTSIDLSNSDVVNIPKNAFANTQRLYSVTLPNSCKSISETVFKSSGIQTIDIPGSVTYIDPSAFDGVTLSNLTFYCPDDSAATTYAEQKGIEHLPYRGKSSFLVNFYMYDYSTNAVKLLKQENVLDGEDATAPTTEECPELLQDSLGWKFTGWNHDGHNITEPTDIYATYNYIDPNAEKLTVEFYNMNNELVKSVQVDSGTDATSLAPSVGDMAVEGYTFTGWRPAITSITEDTKTYAQYTAVAANEYVVNFYDYDQTLLYTQTVAAGGTAIEPKDPVREGYTFTGWLPGFTNIQKDTDVYAQYEKGGSSTDNGSSSDGNNNNGNNNNSNNNGNANFYTLTVRNGSGSGSYVAGAQVIIIADDPAKGQEFSNWTVDPTDVTIASKNVGATVLTMPEKAVTVTANYKAGGSGSGASAGSTGSGNSTGGKIVKPTTSGGTTVVIDKNGLSNTGVVSATVNGSSDNFVIKITEDASATEAIVKALMNEYGDLTNIAYFPMDISLYDSTGTKKITDTSGLSISITLPLPDSMITYAGNNKVAGVVNDRLDKLSPKFSTIDGVSCVTFTATHFSPYVIYVDTQNLTAGTISDSTPKTGDGVHPKWFLAIGLACISMVLFMKQDGNRAARRVKTARA